MNKIRLGAAICGSFCTFEEYMPVLERLCEKYDVTPIMSSATFSTDTRFGGADMWREKIERFTGKKIITSIPDAEPVGPKKLLDVMLVAPCTGNTLAKLANSITDSSVTMAVKAHLRNGRPVVVGVATNDGLAGSAENIGKLLARKNYYFVPFYQDDPEGKPTSLMSALDMIEKTVDAALEGKQIEPILTVKTR